MNYKNFSFLHIRMSDIEILSAKAFLFKSRSKYPKNFLIMLKSEKKIVQNDEILKTEKKVG